MKISGELWGGCFGYGHEDRAALLGLTLEGHEPEPTRALPDLATVQVREGLHRTRLTHFEHYDGVCAWSSQEEE